jgi:hypothetical protein
MYGQPKIHKLNPVRPIISCIGSYIHDLSGYFYQIIENNRPSQSFSYIRDLSEFMKQIIGITDSSNEVIISFNFYNLFTNVPVNEAIEITLYALFKRSLLPDIPFHLYSIKTAISNGCM